MKWHVFCFKIHLKPGLKEFMSVKSGCPLRNWATPWVDHQGLHIVPNLSFLTPFFMFCFCFINGGSRYVLSFKVHLYLGVVQHWSCRGPPTILNVSIQGFEPVSFWLTGERLINTTQRRHPCQSLDKKYTRGNSLSNSPCGMTPSHSHQVRRISWTKQKTLCSSLLPLEPHFSWPAAPISDELSSICSLSLPELFPNGSLLLPAADQLSTPSARMQGRSTAIVSPNYYQYYG